MELRSLKALVRRRKYLAELQAELLRKSEIDKVAVFESLGDDEATEESIDRELADIDAEIAERTGQTRTIPEPPGLPDI